MTPLQLLFLVFGTVFIAEMGDKTQLLLVAMAGKYKVRDILIGTWAATLVLNLLAVAVGAALSEYLDMRIIKSAAALAFFYFAWSGLRKSPEEEEKLRTSRFGPVAAIFATFFLGELGDKTQLSAITLAAAYADGALVRAALICLGCTLGLIAADAIGLAAGLLLKNQIPTVWLQRLTFLVFAAFGVLNAHEALSLMMPACPMAVWLVLAGVTLAFAALCYATWKKARKT